MSVLNDKQKNDINDTYNQAIVPVLKAQGVIINDLNTLVKQNIDQYICGDYILLSPEGKMICTAAVAEIIKSIR